VTLLGVALIGLLIGFLGGLLGKGGSAIATPMLHAIGIPAIIAVASPLPATIPSTLAAGFAYSKQRLVDWRIVRWSIGFGAPATVAGALATRWVSGGALVKVTDVILVVLGIRLLVVTWRTASHDQPTQLAVVAEQAPAARPTATLTSTATLTRTDPAAPTGVMIEPTALALAAVACTVGLVSGLLANSGGFLLAPLFMTVLRQPIKPALASSLAVASVLALPGTVVHATLGHIDWTVVAVLASTSVPLSFLGARVALRTDPLRLERLYGIALVVLGTGFLVLR
jgi:uncharacterized membrane protein YfcA